MKVKNYNIHWHKKIAKNRYGKDYFVGDIHGEYSMLMKKLSSRSFDNKIDRLFCVGDLINKGPESEKCIDLLSEPWFFTAIGNHELMFLDAIKNNDPTNLIQFGGRWVAGYSDEDLVVFSDKIIKNSYVSLTVETRLGTVGIVHASSPSNWRVMQVKNNNGDECKRLMNLAAWSFEQGDLARHDKCSIIENVGAVVSGHISTEDIIVSKNHVWIDTLRHGDGLTLLNSNEIFSLIDWKK